MKRSGLILIAFALLPLLAAEAPPDTAVARWQTAVQKIGGEKTDFSSIEARGKLITVFGDQESAVEQTLSYQLPDRLRTTIAMQGGIVVIANGDAGVMKMGDQRLPLGAGSVRIQLQELKRSFFSLVQQHDNPTLQVKTVEGPAAEQTAHGWKCPSPAFSPISASVNPVKLLTSFTRADIHFSKHPANSVSDSTTTAKLRAVGFRTAGRSRSTTP